MQRLAICHSKANTVSFRGTSARTWSNAHERQLGLPGDGAVGIGVVEDEGLGRVANGCFPPPRPPPFADGFKPPRPPPFTAPLIPVVKGTGASKGIS